MIQRLLSLSILLAAVAAPSGARASEEAPEVPEARTSSAVDLTMLRVPWTERSGRGVAFAYDAGMWGQDWMQGLRIKIPLGEHVYVNARGIVLFTPSGSPWPDRVDLGGRLELGGATPVFLNLVRLYGGGGVSAFAPVSGVSGDKPVSIGGGGYFGFEFFVFHRMSWILEVGGNGGVGGSGSGATITAGLQIYPF
jgi:hypothetical protein